MPRIVALLGSGMGLALASLGFAGYLWAAPHENTARVELFAAVFAGALTFAISAIAFGKLRGAWRFEPVACPGHHLVNLSALLLCGWLGYGFVIERAAPFGLAALLATGTLAAAIGAHLMCSREYPGEALHASRRDGGCAPRPLAFAARSEGLPAARAGLLANIEWHGGDEQRWALRDEAPAIARISAGLGRDAGHRGRRANDRLRDWARARRHEPSRFDRRPVPFITGR